MLGRRISFVKMHGLGNDFVVIDGRERENEKEWSGLARKMLDRHFGVGGDQLLLVCNSHTADFKMRLWNTDGLEAEMCGNGVRCVAKWIFDKNLAGKDSISIETLGGKKVVRRVQVEDELQYEVQMGVPKLVKECTLLVEDKRLEVVAIDMGNPHAVAFIEENVNAFDLPHYGKQVEHNLSEFPNRTNFEICNVKENGDLEMRVWERSVGLTLACGSGACAVAAAAMLKNKVKGPRVKVILPGGPLQIQWQTQAEQIVMTGPATTVFFGEWLD